MSEQCDVVIVGARCAGSSAASALARAGRSVVVLDKARFPSDTLSTHILFPMGVAELRRMGALERILALDPAPMTHLRLVTPAVTYHARYRPVAGIDYGVCVPRTVQDQALVETARAHGADVRERSELLDLLWEGGRAVGVRYRDPDRAVRELRCRLVIGADGRRSTVAARVGAWTPYRVSRNGRGLIFRYLDEPRPDSVDAHTLIQWRDGDSFGLVFPCTPRGRLLVLFMGHRDESSWARRDAEGYWSAKLAEHPGLAERIDGGGNATKLRSTGDVPAFFRASSGPGWALAGDAGHFKDPVIGQGMRDAMWMGRTLAEAVLPRLDDPAETDRATRRWEHERDRECLPAYHLGNRETRVDRVSPVFEETLRQFVPGNPDVADMFQRIQSPQAVLSLDRLARGLATAVRRAPYARRAGLVRWGTEFVRIDLGVRAERRRDRFRSTETGGLLRGSEHPGAPWPALPQPTVEAVQEEVAA